MGMKHSLNHHQMHGTSLASAGLRESPEVVFFTILKPSHVPSQLLARSRFWGISYGFILQKGLSLLVKLSWKTIKRKRSPKQAGMPHCACVRKGAGGNGGKQPFVKQKQLRKET